MKKTILLSLILVMILSGCSKAVTLNNDAASASATAVTTKTKIPTASSTVVITPSPSPTHSPTPKPTEPRYIFIVIGDGFGKGHMLMGSVFERIKGESMDAFAVWETFTQKHFAQGRGESAGGGTAIATGFVTDPSIISRTLEKQDLYTIMDRAKEAGMGTGVVTNSSILDATPATFLAHAGYRGLFDTICNSMPDSNVDYIAGGGINDVIPEQYKRKIGRLDSSGFPINLDANSIGYSRMLELGYKTYIGMDGALEFAQTLENDNFKDEKVLAIFTGGNMPYESYKQNIYRAESMKNTPNLVEMTNAGISTLYNNEKGFVMMIEEASIDKTGHHGLQKATLSQVDMLNQTLVVLMEFYNQHPDETLIILTADHETGNYKFDEERFEQFKTFEDYTYTQDGEKMSAFFDEKWGIGIPAYLINKEVRNINLNVWEDEDENRAIFNTYLAYQTSIALGIERMTEDHSMQPVPCYTIGVRSEDFAVADGIEDIPIIICEIMGWEALPEIIER